MSSIFFSAHHARKCRLVNSGPLSQRSEVGRSVLFDDSVQSSGHLPTRHACTHLYRRTYAGEAIDHRQGAQSAPARQSVGNEVQRPFLIRPQYQRVRRYCVPKPLSLLPRHCPGLPAGTGDARVRCWLSSSAGRSATPTTGDSQTVGAGRLLSATLHVIFRFCLDVVRNDNSSGPPPEACKRHAH